MAVNTISSLVVRHIFDHGDDAEHVCPVKNHNGPPIVPLFGSMTFHTFATILSGSCAIASCLITLFIIFQHATHFSNPVQQRQIIRIVLLVPWVAIFSYLIVQTSAGGYLTESLDFGCAIALSSFLLLLCDYVLANEGGFDDLFGENAWKNGQFSSQSPPWLKRVWYAVLQFIPTSIIVWFGSIITLATGTYCAASNNIHFAHIWITVLKFIVTTVAIIAVLRFYKRMKVQLAPHRAFFKLFAFKGIIGLNVFQTFVINILSGHSVLKPTKHLTYDDIISLPALILACEMPLFAIMLVVAFPVSPYKNGKTGASALSAMVQAFNLSDLLSAFVRGPMRLVREQQRNIVRQDSIPLSYSTPPTYDTGYDPQGMEYNVGESQRDFKLNSRV